MMGGTFVSVGGGNAFSLADLTVSGYDTDEGAWGEFMLKVLDNFGLTAKDDEGNDMVYCWQDNEDYDNPCWTNPDGDVWDNVTFSAGQGFWIQGEGYTLQCAGQVYNEDVPVPTAKSGNTAISNPFPTEITLANMSVSGYDTDEGAWGEFMVKILDNFGLTAKDGDGNDKVYCWQDNEDYETACWTNPDGDELDETISFAAGQGFWVQGEGYTIQFTNPIPRN